MNLNNKILITDLVDNEITDELIKKEVEELCENDSSLMFDFRVQKLMKSLVSERCKIVHTPDAIRKKILKQISPKAERKNLSFIENIFYRPSFAFGIILFITLVTIFYMSNKSTEVAEKIFALEQFGEDNMFVQAKNNFKSITEGKLSPQFISNNPNQIDKFFKESGVKYPTKIPVYNEWGLLGAVVSEDKGEKFAHHVYANEEGKLVYIFQVDEVYLEKHKILILSDDLLKYLNAGNCYRFSEENTTVILSKTENKIFAVVTNEELNKIDEYFCKI